MPDQSWVGPECGERVRAELLKLLPRLGRRKIEMNERIQLNQHGAPEVDFTTPLVGSESRDSVLSGDSGVWIVEHPRATERAISKTQQHQCAPLGPRLRCDCAVTAAVHSRVSEHPGIPTRLKTQ